MLLDWILCHWVSRTAAEVKTCEQELITELPTVRVIEHSTATELSLKKEPYVLLWWRFYKRQRGATGTAGGWWSQYVTLLPLSGDDDVSETCQNVTLYVGILVATHYQYVTPPVTNVSHQCNGQRVICWTLCNAQSTCHMSHCGGWG